MRASVRTVAAARLALVATLAASTPAAAQQVVNSETIDAVAVTLYRDPDRDDGATRSDWPGGYALITETRTIRVPAGRSVIRFQGVSQGVLPETAIVTGLPRQVSEKNRDALLLSPAGLVDAWLKRRVTLHRTDGATGRIKVQDAVIEAGPGGGVVLTTRDGVEALGCSGLPEAIDYAGVPDGLFAKPTLSVVTESVAATTVQVQLSYIAEGLDWSAHYVAHVAADGKTLDLFAWLTVVNGGSQGFANARTQAVAGRPNKERAADQPAGPAPELRLQCWPMDITSTHPLRRFERLPWRTSRSGALGDRDYGDIVVTGMRRSEPLMNVPVAVSAVSAVMVAQQEDLGDLKLYRIPEPVTVAARSTKQVAMLDRKRVRFERIYTAHFDLAPRGPQATGITLRTTNREAEGLGLPLPSGGVAVFESLAGAPMLVGESDLADRAIGDDVEFGAGESADLRYEITALPTRGLTARYRIHVTNARSTREMFEIGLPANAVASGGRLGKRNGKVIWRTSVPANGEAALDLALRKD